MTEIAGIAIPDSEICNAARDYAERVSEPFLFNHVMRTYVFGEIVGAKRGLKPDHELLFVAAVLHDLGITDVVPVKARFELEGADAAKEFLATRGMSDKNIDIVWKAIALHTTFAVPQNMRPEIALTQVGAAVDVGAMPLSALSEAVIAEILDAYPRLGFKQALVQAFLGLYEKNPAAAVASHIVADICDQHIADYQRPRFCNVIENAAFAE